MELRPTPTKLPSGGPGRHDACGRQAGRADADKVALDVRPVGAYSERIAGWVPPVNLMIDRPRMVLFGALTNKAVWTLLLPSIGCEYRCLTPVQTHCCSLKHRAVCSHRSSFRRRRGSATT